jgi:hypothetical protein
MKPNLALAVAARLYDDPALPLARAARDAWRGGFATGAEWMRLALGVMRGTPPKGRTSFQMLGFGKYLLCLAAAALMLVPGRIFWPLAVLAFYAIEVQMVFLFPLALDGRADLLRSSRALTRRAGGTLPVMAKVMRIAAGMLGNPLLGRDPVRAWSLGCLAVLVWYEEVRRDD